MERRTFIYVLILKKKMEEKCEARIAWYFLIKFGAPYFNIFLMCVLFCFLRSFVEKWWFVGIGISFNKKSEFWSMIWTNQIWTVLLVVRSEEIFLLENYGWTYVSKWNDSTPPIDVLLHRTMAVHSHFAGSHLSCTSRFLLYIHC